MKRIRPTHKLQLPRLKLRTLIALFVIVILLPIAIFLLYKAKFSKAAWYDSTWGYRQSITITNNSGSQADYVVAVPVNTYALTSTSKLQSDCSDLIFTKSDGIT